MIELVSMLASGRVLKITITYVKTAITVEIIRKVRFVPQPSPPNSMYWKTSQTMLAQVVTTNITISMIPLQLQGLPPSFSTLETSKSLRPYAITNIMIAWYIRKMTETILAN